MGKEKFVMHERRSNGLRKVTKKESRKCRSYNITSLLNLSNSIKIRVVIE